MYEYRKFLVVARRVCAELMTSIFLSEDIVLMSKLRSQVRSKREEDTETRNM